MKGPWVRGCPLIQQTAPIRKAKRPACLKQEQNSLVRLNHESVFNVAPRIKHHQTLLKPGSPPVMFSWCYPGFYHVLSINPNSKRVRRVILHHVAMALRRPRRVHCLCRREAHQMPKMPGGALASWGCWKAGKRQRRARDLGRGDHEIWWDAMPISSMYGIYANIGGILMINVTIYSIHGSYGMGMNGNIMRVFEGMQWDYNQLWVFLVCQK